MNANLRSDKQRFLLPIFFFSISFLFLMVCSKSSFLYAINDWPDVNIYYTLGKGIVDGQVPYRDLFEQKGPLLFFIYALAYVLSPTNYIGSFVLEVLSFTVLLFYIYKIMTLYISSKASALLIPVFSLLLVTSNSFYYGGSAEEFVLPPLTVGLYHLLRFFRHGGNISYKAVFVNGIFAGCVLWIKYTMLGFWLAWMASLFFIMVYQKQAARAFRSCLVFLGGMALASLPILLYFFANNALQELFYTYFYVNLFAYAEHTSILWRLLMLLLLPLWHMIQNWAISIFIIIGIFAFMVQKKYLSQTYMRVSLLSCFLLLNVSVFFRGTAYAYYFFIFSPFAILGLIAAFDSLRAKLNSPRKLSSFAGVIVIAVCFVFSWLLSPNTKMIGTEKKEFAQFQFAESMNAEPGATLLCYNMLDDGFYYNAGIRPTEKFYCIFNLPEKYFPEQFDEQRQAINEKRVRFVVLKSTKPLEEGQFTSDHAWVSENYEYVERATQFHEYSDVTYLLYRARP